MKKKDKAGMLLFLLLMLCPMFCVEAKTQKYIVKLNDKIIPEQLSQVITEVNAKHNVYTTYDSDVLEEYSEYIECIEPSRELVLIEGKEEPRLFLALHETDDNEQKRAKMIHSSYAWDLMTYGNAVNVAIIDSGCNPHEDLDIAGGYNFILGNEDYTDRHGHGTHVAGMISAQHNSIGINGVAPKVNIYALKCVDPSYYSDEVELIEAIYAAVDIYNCKVINMSLGILDDGDDGVSLLYDAVKYAADKGVIIVASAGNDGRNSAKKGQVYYPAGFDEVIGVGSVSLSRRRSDFSQQNDTVFVVAPGEDCLSTTRSGGYGEKSGTSQATPLVASAAAIMLSADEDMTAEEFKKYIIDGSDAIEDSFCGHGLLNIEAMLAECIKDSYYVSPLNSDGVVIFNNTAAPLNAIGILAKYQNARCNFLNTTQIALPAGEKVKINNTGYAGVNKFFLWNSFENPNSIVKAKVVTNPK